MLSTIGETARDYYDTISAFEKGDTSFTGKEGTLKFFASLVSTLQRWSDKVIYWDPVEEEYSEKKGGHIPQGAELRSRSGPMRRQRRVRVRLYTDHYSYSISAVESDLGVSDSYLGCIASSRKTNIEEEQHRGSDLPDGKLTLETWHDIMAGIVAFEIAHAAGELHTYTPRRGYKATWPETLNAEPELAAVNKAMQRKPLREVAETLAAKLTVQELPDGWLEVAADPLEYLRTQVKTLAEAYEWMEKHEPPGLGSGYFANVYDVKGTAVKLSGDDRCWQLFAKYAKRKPSKYLPKIHWVRQVEGGFVAAMEKLQPVYDLDDLARDPHILLYAMLNFAYLGPAEYKYILRLFASNWPRYDPKVVDGKVTDKSYWDHPFVRIMTDMEGVSGCRVDIHTENVMQRGSRQIVVVDPIIRTREYSPHVKGILRRVKGWQEEYLGKLDHQARHATKSVLA